MLKRLSLSNVGPASSLQLEPVAPRFNLLTGDNGLGKSFLLETAWWALTRTWHETPAVPSTPKAAIGYSFDGDKKVHTSTSHWNPPAQEWKRKAGRPPNPGLVLYARIDGSFSVWDPARNYRLYQRPDGGRTQSPPAYQFSSQAVFEGLKRKVDEGGAQREQVLCAGLIDDWTRWQESNNPRFDLLCQLLDHLGPDEQPLQPGTPVRPSLDDQRHIPTIKMPYHQEVPITYAPAGVKRMTKLAYLLAWAFAEHQEEAKRIEQPLSKHIIVLFDEPETHLHPRWQRTILPSLVKTIEGWSDTITPQVQFLIATHSPLILASMEPFFAPEQDALWKLDLVDGDVVVEKDSWHMRGDVNRWLMSDVFDLGLATSLPAERILSQAKNLMKAENPKADLVLEVNEKLANALPEMDPFLIRWRYYMQKIIEKATP